MTNGTELKITHDGEEIGTVTDTELSVEVTDVDSTTREYIRDGVTYEINIQEYLENNSYRVNYQLMEVFGEEENKMRFQRDYEYFTFSEWMAITSRMMTLRQWFQQYV